MLDDALYGELLSRLKSAVRSVTPTMEYFDWERNAALNAAEEAHRTRWMNGALQRIREEVIEPILGALGWHVGDHDVVSLPKDEQFPYYYVLWLFGQPYIVLLHRTFMFDEDEEPEGMRDSQLGWFGYSARLGARWYVETDGALWRTYDLCTRGEDGSACFQTVQVYRAIGANEYPHSVDQLLFLARETAARCARATPPGGHNCRIVPCQDGQGLEEYYLDQRVRTALYRLLESGDKRIVDVLLETAPSLLLHTDDIPSSLFRVRLDLENGTSSAAFERVHLIKETTEDDRLVDFRDEDWLPEDSSEEDPPFDLFEEISGAIEEWFPEVCQEGVKVAADSEFSPPLALDEEDDDASSGDVEADEGATVDCIGTDDTTHRSHEPSKETLGVDHETESDYEEDDVDVEAEQARIEMGDLLKDILDPEFEWQCFHDDDPADYTVEERPRNWVDDFNLGDPYRGI